MKRLRDYEEYMKDYKPVVEDIVVNAEDMYINTTAGVDTVSTGAISDVVNKIRNMALDSQVRAIIPVISLDEAKVKFGQYEI